MRAHIKTYYEQTNRLWQTNKDAKPPGSLPYALENLDRSVSMDCCSSLDIALKNPLTFPSIFESASLAVNCHVGGGWGLRDGLTICKLTGHVATPVQLNIRISALEGISTKILFSPNSVDTLRGAYGKC